MTFLAPWAFAIGALGALGVVLFHLVARTRPAAYVLPTARFIPDQRSLVSRVASRPRDLLLLLLRVLLLLVVSAAFARPVLTPSSGTIGHVVLVDRSRVVGSLADEVAMARKLVPSGARSVLIVFDSVPVVLGGSAALDAVEKLGRSGANGSITAALVAARRASVDLAESVDSVALHVVSPMATSEVDSGTSLARAAWPGLLDVQRSALRPDSAQAWKMSREISVSDQLGPALSQTARSRALAGRGTAAASASERAVRRMSQLVRGQLSAGDSTFARNGGTIVRWDTAGGAFRLAAEGLAVGDDVIVAALGRVSGLPNGRVVARWADATPAAVEETFGAGCVRTVGVIVPSAGDLALHPPFQRMARGLLAPCGLGSSGTGADSATIASLARGASSRGPRRMASARELRATVSHPSPVVRWLLLAALALAVAELAVRARGAREATA